LTGIPPLVSANGEFGAYPSGHFNKAESWLCGGRYTDAKGIAEVTTIYPGYYEGRAPRIHLMVHKDWTQSSDGFVRVVCPIQSIREPLQTKTPGCGSLVWADY